MYAITPNGIGKKVGMRLIRTGWPLVAGEKFSVDEWNEDFVLSEDGASLRERSDNEVLDEYKSNAIAINQTEAGNLIALLFGTVADGFISGSDKLQLRQVNNVAEAVALTLRTALGTNAGDDDERLEVLVTLKTDLDAIRKSENTAATLINAVSTDDLETDKRTIDNISVLWPTWPL